MIPIAHTVAASILSLSLVPLMGGSVDDAQAVIIDLAEQIRDNYVFPEIGERTADYLIQQARDGAYDGLTEQRLAMEVTEDLREYTHDLHFVLRMLPEDWESQQQDEDRDLADPRSNTTPNGFMRVERLDGNIGYLKLDGFMQADVARDNANAAMQLLAGSSALIFDLRNNGGGDPETVQLITSYLFDPNEPVHLNSLYFRPTNETTEYWTLSDIQTDNAMPDVPVYVLTSRYTFSAAEEFTYNLQCLDRATIIGENTGGGAHPVDGFVLANRFVANIPVGRAINPITGTNWEGSGVKPDIAVPSPQALDTAIGEVLTHMVENGDEGARWGLIAHTSRNSPLALTESELAQYAGQYTDRELVMNDGSLKYRRKGRTNWSDLIAVDTDQFVIDGFDGFLMTFERDDTGQIARIVGSYKQGHTDRSERQ